MLYHLLCSAGGQVRVRVTGAPLERFLNLCLRENIKLHSIERQDWNRLQCTLSLHDFRRLRPKMGRTGCRVHILHRSGLPFLLRTMQHRFVFSAGFLVLAVAIWFLHSRLWILQLKTPPGISSAELSRALAAEGVTIGMRLSDFDSESVQRSLMIKMDNISYVGFNRMGNHMIVDVHKKKEQPDILDATAVTSVVARRAGQIVRITPIGGWAVVKPGDIVATGEKLIDALVPPSRDAEGMSPRLTWSDGDVIARTWYQKTILRPISVLRKHYTGKTKTQYALILGKKRINLYLGSGICGAGCDKIVKVSYLTVTDGLTLPAALVKQTYRYYEPETVSVDEETLRQDMEERALAALTSEVCGEVTSHKAPAKRTEAGALEMQFSAEALEDIGEVVEDSQTLPAPEPDPAETQE